VTILPTRVAMPEVTNLRNLAVVPGDPLTLTYASVELRPEDRTVGLTLVSATLTVADAFGLTPSLTLTVTTTGTADGQVTDTASSTGVGAFHFAIADTVTATWTAPLAFEIKVTDSSGRATPFDAGHLVPATGHEYDFAPVARVIIAPTEFRLNMGSATQLAMIAVDEHGIPLTDRIIDRTSSNTGIATVDALGVVAGVGIGTATITATADGVSSFATVMVPEADFSDTFSRADGPIGTAETGQVWQVLDGDWIVTGRQARLQGGFVGTADKHVAVIETMRADGTASVRAGVIGSYGTRLVLRCTDVDNYLFVDWSGSTLSLRRRVAFVDTTLASTTYAVVEDDLVAAILLGSAITVTVNGVTKLGPTTETFNVGATMHGLGAYDSASSTFDNFHFAV
jgi:hypothetical protein